MPEGIVVTAETVTDWLDRIDQLNVEIGEREKERDLLNRRLQALEVMQTLQRSDVDKIQVVGKESSKPGKGVIPPDTPLPRAVRNVLGGNEALTATEIRNALLNRSFPPEKFGINNAYFYTVLKRLVTKKSVNRRGDKYRLSPK